MNIWKFLPQLTDKQRMMSISGDLRELADLTQFVVAECSTVEELQTHLERYAVTAEQLYLAAIRAGTLPGHTHAYFYGAMPGHATIQPQTVEGWRTHGLEMAKMLLTIAELVATPAPTP